MDRAHPAECAFRQLDIRAFNLRRAATSLSRGKRAMSAASTPVPSHKGTPILSRLPASAQNLPVEVVVQILAYALPSIYDRAADFRSDSTAFYCGVTSDFRCVLKDTQLYLYRAALVCRAWYPVANELLYGCPFFTAHGSVVSFGRTLKAVSELRQLVKEVWFFNEEGPKRLDPMGLKRKSVRRTQMDLSMILRAYTSLDSFIVCNHGLLDRSNFPIDNILVYGLPPTLDVNYIPKLVLHGPAIFNEPWARHAKPNNLDPQHLEVLCMQDIESSPAELKCSPYLPTLPRLHTLRICMRTHDETPFVSSGTFPSLRTLEVYRDVFDNRRPECMRPIAVDSACLRKLDRLHLVGRSVESALFRLWAEEQLLNSVRHLAVGLVHSRDHEFLAEWRLPDSLETLVVLVWHDESQTTHGLGELGDARGLLTALASCVQRNRQHRTFKKLEIRATAVLPSALQHLVRDIRDKCQSYHFTCRYQEGGIEDWISQRLSGARSC